MATRHQQYDRRKAEQRVFEEGGMEVALHMVHAHEGQAPGPCVRLRSAGTDEQGTDEPRPDRGCDCVQVARSDRRPTKSFGDSRA
jgi:hypothetical protein